MVFPLFLNLDLSSLSFILRLLFLMCFFLFIKQLPHTITLFFLLELCNCVSIIFFSLFCYLFFKIRIMSESRCFLTVLTVILEKKKYESYMPEIRKMCLISYLLRINGELLPV